MDNIPQTPEEYREWYLGNLPEGIQWGECWCGCGERTTLAAQTEHRHLHFRGEPVKFITGHNARRGSVDYIVEDRGHETPCWIWQRYTDHNGYGIRRVAGSNTTAHRAYYERICGPIPEGLTLDHLCRVRNCVNPSHLEPVTQGENARRGSQSKLTQAKADEIRSLYANGISARELALLFNVTHGHIHHVLRRVCWSD